jgi:hypothetical protein
MREPESPQGERAPSEPESPQGERGATRAGRSELARTGLSEERAPSEPGVAAEPETYNPWSVVNVVFHHLAEAGLHPVLGSAGDPGPPATALLRAFGIEPSVEGSRQAAVDVRAHLAEIRAALLGPEPDA